MWALPAALSNRSPRQTCDCTDSGELHALLETYGVQQAAPAGPGISGPLDTRGARPRPCCGLPPPGAQALAGVLTRSPPPYPEEPRSGVSKDGQPHTPFAILRDSPSALLRMRFQTPSALLGDEVRDAPCCLPPRAQYLSHSSGCIRQTCGGGIRGRVTRRDRRRAAAARIYEERSAPAHAAACLPSPGWRPARWGRIAMHTTMTTKITPEA